MASNPMQKKARQSFLLGVLLTMIVLGSVIGLLLYREYQAKKAEEKEELSKVIVYVLNQDVSAGTSMKESKDLKDKKFYTTLEIEQTMLPSKALTKENISQYTSDSKVFKIDFSKGTVLTETMFAESNDVIDEEHSDVREQEYSVFVLPTYLKKDDFVDLRLRLPSGEDYIVVSKKKVIDTDARTIWLHLTESDMLTISNAIVENYMIMGSELYITNYVEPGIQNASDVTYVPSQNVLNLMQSNSNIAKTALEELSKKYEKLYSHRTQIINPLLSSRDEPLEYIEDQVEKNIVTQQESRTQYLEELEAKAQAAQAAQNSANKKK